VRIAIKSDGAPHRVKIINEETGEPLNGVTKVTWRAEVNDICRADIEVIIVPAEIVGAVAKVFGPNGKQIRRIEYADGTTEEYPAEEGENV
jgi:hypothetical protein